MELESKLTLNMLPVVLYVTSTVSMIVLNDISSLDVPHPLCLYIHKIEVFIKVTTQLSPLEYITKQISCVVTSIKTYILWTLHLLGLDRNL